MQKYRSCPRCKTRITTTKKVKKDSSDIQYITGSVTSLLFLCIWINLHYIWSESILGHFQMYFQSSKHYHHAHWVNAHMDFNVTEGNRDSLTENTLIYSNILNLATSQVITAFYLFCIMLNISAFPSR